MPTEISLNCWIVGFDAVNPVLAELAPSKTVNNLKQEIKKTMAPDLIHTSAPKLEIWRVNT